jgi:tetratricopeptide (TPR) repeat protein
MNPLRILPTLLLACLLLGAGCSRGQRTTRILAAVDRHLAAGDLSAAEIECRNLLQLDATHAGALRRLGLIYWDQGREHRAVPILRSALKLDPSDTGARVRLARFRLACGDHAGAMEEATAVLRRDPADADAPIILALAAAPEADAQRRARDLLHGLPATASAPVLVALGLIDLRGGRTAAAEAAFHHALRSDPRFAPARDALGLLHWGRGDRAGAEAAFREAAETGPPYSPHRERLTRFLLMNGKPEEALGLASGATARTPDHLPSWIVRAECASATRDLAGAEAHLKEALRRDPAHPAALSASARLALARGDPAGAVATLERLRALHPGLPQAGYELALASLAAGDTNRAVSLLDEVIQAAPALREAALARAELGLRRGDPAAAAEVLEPLLRDQPDLPAARALLAAARWRQGRSDEALALCLEIERAMPASPQAPFLHGVILAGRGSIGEARASLERALTLAPGDHAIVEQIVELELAARRPDSARRLLEAELARMPPRLEPALLLARVHALSGDTEAADTVLSAAAQRHADSAVAHYALALLRRTTKGGGNALAPARRALELQPRSVAAALLVAELEEARGDSSAARAAYGTVLALRPDEPAALTALPRLLLASPADLERALTLAERARGLRPDAPEAAGVLGTVLNRRGDTARALPLLRQATAGLPHDAALHAELARALLLRGDEAAAQSAYQRTLELGSQPERDREARDVLAVLALPADAAPPAAEPLLTRRLAAGKDDPATRIRLASILLRRGETTPALQQAEAALALTPAHPVAALLAARISAERGQAARAIGILKAARENAPGDATLSRALGRVVLDHGTDHPWALHLLQEASRRNPGDDDGEFDLSRALYANDRVTEALPRLAAARPAAPGWPRAAEHLAFAEWARKADADAPHPYDPEAARTAALPGKPPAPLLWLLARSARQRGDTKEAGQRCEELILAWPHFSPAIALAVTLHAATRPPPEYLRESVSLLVAGADLPPELRRDAGLILCRLGENARGATALETALTARPDDPEALVELGRACLALGRTDEGRSLLRRALASSPPRSLADTARSALGAAN